jgi:hypothetical protein
MPIRPLRVSVLIPIVFSAVAAASLRGNADRAAGAADHRLDPFIIGRGRCAYRFVAVLNRGDAPAERGRLHALGRLVGNEAGYGRRVSREGGEALRLAPAYARRVAGDFSLAAKPSLRKINEGVRGGREDAECV